MRMPFMLTAALVSPALVVADQPGETLEITEWPVPWEQTRPRDPDVAADGSIWFVGQAGDYVGRLDPETGEFRRYDLPDGTGPHNVIVTDDDQIWYAGNRAAHLGRLDPADGGIEKIDTHTDRARDPHTLIEDDRGRIWFTSQHANTVGRYDRESGDIELVDVPTDKARPYGIVLDDSGDAWVALHGTYKLARVDAETLALTEIEVPRDKARPRRLGHADRGLWYVDYARGYLGLYDPESETFTEWRAPGGEESGPYAMTIDDKGRPWFVETWQQPNRFVGFDPESEEFFGLTDIPSGGGTVRHMVFDPERRAIWFGTDTNTIGKAVVPE